MAQLLQVRRGAASVWTSNNPVLASGEIGFETDTYKFKIGDGVSNWTTLAYFSSGAPSGGTSDPLQMAGNEVKLVYRSANSRWELPNGVVPNLTNRLAAITWEGTASQIPPQGTTASSFKIGDTALIRNESL